MVKKLLLALDCSLPSQRAVEYAADIARYLPECTVTLFVVLTGVPYSEEVVRELMGPHAVELHGDEDHEQELGQVRKFLAQAGRIFADRGFPAERLKTATKPLQRGVAQDILDEAQVLDCDTVVVGRRGLSKMQQAVLGSVSRDLIQKAEGLAIWVVED